MCNSIPYPVVEALLAPVTVLTYGSLVLLILVGPISLAVDTNTDIPHCHYRQLMLPGFKSKAGYFPRWFCWILPPITTLLQKITLDGIFWTLATAVGCGLTTHMMTLASWIIHAYVHCPSATT